MRHLLIVMLFGFQYITAQISEYKPSAYDENLFREQQKYLIERLHGIKNELFAYMVENNKNLDEDIRWMHNALRIPSNILNGSEPQLSPNQVKEMSNGLSYSVAELNHNKYNNTWSFSFKWNYSSSFGGLNGTSYATDLMELTNIILAWKSAMINWCNSPINNTCHQYLSKNETTYDDGPSNTLRENYNKLLTESNKLSSDSGWAGIVKEIVNLNNIIHPKEQTSVNTTIEDLLLTLIKSNFRIRTAYLHRILDSNYDQVDKAQDLLSRWHEHTVTAIKWKIQNESSNSKESILHSGAAK